MPIHRRRVDAGIRHHLRQPSSIGSKRPKAHRISVGHYRQQVAARSFRGGLFTPKNPRLDIASPCPIRAACLHVTRPQRSSGRFVAIKPLSKSNATIMPRSSRRSPPQTAECRSPNPRSTGSHFPPSIHRRHKSDSKCFPYS